MDRQRRRLSRQLAAGLGLLALGTRPDAAGSAEPKAVAVDIRDYKFIPEVLNVKVGTTVRWTNQERRTTHSVLFLGADKLESERMFPGESWERRFDKPGTYDYSCGPHPEMKGRVVVE